MLYPSCITNSCQGNQQNSKVFHKKGGYGYKQGHFKLCLEIIKVLVGTCRGFCSAYWCLLHAQFQLDKK